MTDKQPRFFPVEIRHSKPFIVPPLRTLTSAQEAGLIRALDDAQRRMIARLERELFDFLAAPRCPLLEDFLRRRAEGRRP